MDHDIIVYIEEQCSEGSLSSSLVIPTLYLIAHWKALLIVRLFVLEWRVVATTILTQWSFTACKYWFHSVTNFNLYIYRIYKSDNKQSRYQAISNYKSFIGYYLMNSWTNSHNQTCIGKYSSNHFQWYMVYPIALSTHRDTSISI